MTVRQSRTQRWVSVRDPERKQTYCTLTDDHTVIGLTAPGRARACPLTLIDRLRSPQRHVRRVGDCNLLSHLPQRDSAQALRRRADTPRHLGAALKHLADLQRRHRQDSRVFPRRDERVSNDGTPGIDNATVGSEWSQMLATALRGEHSGERMVIPMPR
ncbi:MAG: hypothetical protein J07HX5_01885 [halophilic archaeon J07HX5]|jgi:hypothetical protein|nr:MAG: hypothetical protein J07HX5_01885 [halophilic archaeon J07HX5]